MRENDMSDGPRPTNIIYVLAFLLIVHARDKYRIKKDIDVVSAFCVYVQC